MIRSLRVSAVSRDRKFVLTHKMGLSRTTALFALSLTFPLDHFFFLLRCQLMLVCVSPSISTPKSFSPPYLDFH